MPEHSRVPPAKCIRSMPKAHLSYIIPGCAWGALGHGVEDYLYTVGGVFNTIRTLSWPVWSSFDVQNIIFIINITSKAHKHYFIWQKSLQSADNMTRVSSDDCESSHQCKGKSSSIAVLRRNYGNRLGLEWWLHHLKAHWGYCVWRAALWTKQTSSWVKEWWPPLW